MMNRLLIRLLRKSMSLKSVLVLMLLLSFIESQNIPASYTYSSTTEIISVNGSSATGHCSNVTTTSDGTTTCTAPSSSVLFDGNIPTLTGLDGNMWASQLLTLQPTTGMSAEIIFDFSNNTNFRLERLEVVMFNCPQRGTAVQNIRLFDPTVVVTYPPIITSCDSLVRVCIPASSSLPSLSLQFFSHPGSEWVLYLAELKFFGNSINCPQNIVITTPTPPDTTLATLTNPTSSNNMFTTAKSVTKTNTGVTQNITTISTLSNASSTPPSFTIVLVVVLTSLLLILVGIVAAVLILWRCYCAKHYKHNNTDQHTALEQFQHTSSSQAQTHTHPALTLCEETGQVHYASPHHAQGEDSPSHQTYSHLQQQTCKVGGARVHERGSAGQKEGMGEYSTLLHGHNRPCELERTELGASGTESSLCTQQYTQYSSESDTRVDLLYAQVDKKKKKMQKDEATTQLHTSETDQLYAQVDKKGGKRKKDEETTQLHTSETDTLVDQLYAQVDKEKKEKVSRKESGAVYSVVNKLSAPQLPPKSQLLMEELQ